MDATTKRELPPAPKNPAGHAPVRRHGSVRRTTTIDMTWPDGRGEPYTLSGRGRDIYTPLDTMTPKILDERAVLAKLDITRTILEIEAMPPQDHVKELVGARGGGHLRAKLAEVVPEEFKEETPLYLLLDDISGASLVSGWVWSRWTDDWRNPPKSDDPPMTRNMEGVCIGFSPGSSALMGDGTSKEEQNSCPVVSLRNPEDPEGWHEFDPEPKDPSPKVSMRRARRIDVWQSDAIEIDAAFQDSGSSPDGGRVAIHEYRLSVKADPKSFELLSVEADPRVLPYRECPTAALNVNRLLGVPMPSLRSVVLNELRKTQGCTHLNDALRALAEVPVLLAQLNKQND